MSISDIDKFLVAMIIMMNPLGSLSIFLQLTNNFSSSHQRKIALQCTVAMIVIMTTSIWLGNDLLQVMGITIASFRFAGGIILLLVGLSMLQTQESAVNHTPGDDVAAAERESVAIVPLALPIIIGPGAISTLVIASSDYPSAAHKFWLSGLCVFLAIMMGAMLFYATFIRSIVGDSMIKVITRIMGMIIMAIAVGMLANGLIGLLPGLR